MTDRTAKRKRRRQKAVNTWTVRSSPYGRSTLLVGVIDERMVAALAAPGTRHMEGDGSVAYDEWRFAYWDGRPADEVAVDEDPPSYVIEHDLRTVLDRVSARCPEQLAWVRDRLDDRASALAAGLRPDRRGIVPAGARQRERSLLELLAEIEAVLDDPPDSPLDRGWYDALRARVNLYARRELVRGL